MNYKEAIDTIKSNYPPAQYTMLRKALDMAIEALEKQMIIKPIHITAKKEEVLEYIEEAVKGLKKLECKCNGQETCAKCIAILQIDEYTKVTTTRENIELEDLKVCKENLDKKVNKKETLRDFIRNSETEFHFSHADIDNMSDEELEQYVDYLDALWLK